MDLKKIKGIGLNKIYNKRLIINEIKQSQNKMN